MTYKIRKKLDKKFSLCARSVPDISLEEVITVAMDTGYHAVGFAFDNIQELDKTLALDLRERINNSPLFGLDIDVIRIKPGPLNTEVFHFLDLAAIIGIQHVLVVSHDPDFDQTVVKLTELCDHAIDLGLGIVFEFLMLTEYRTLDDAFAVVNAVNRSNAKILIDTLHLVRAGHNPEYISNFDESLFPYIQLCDGKAKINHNDYEEVVFDSRENRFSPGDGELPIHEILRFINTDIPISIEVRSHVLNRLFPDASERASYLILACKKFFE